jgi:hypothetical protein
VTVACQKVLSFAKVLDVKFIGKNLVKLHANWIIREDTALNWRVLDNRKGTGEAYWPGEERLKWSSSSSSSCGGGGITAGVMI